MKKLFLLILGGAVSLQAADWSSYKRLSAAPPKPVVKNPSFDLGTQGWKFAPEARIVPGGGTNLSPGAMVERTDKNSYRLSHMSLPDLVPGKRYNIQAKVRCENVKPGPRGGASIYIEHSDKKGKFISLSGSYPAGISGTRSWTTISINGHLIPPHTGATSVGFYLTKGATGKAWFDDFQITPAESSWILFPVNAPLDRVIRGEALKLRVADSSGKIPAGKLNAWLSFKGKEVTVPLVSGTAVFKGSEKFQGSGKVLIRVVDNAKKLILAETALELSFGAAPGKVSFDSKGCTLVNGKRFLPIGVFANFSKYTADMLAGAGFNVIMGGNMVHASMPGRKGFDGIRAAMDYCRKKNLYVIFSMCKLYNWGSPVFQRPLHGVKGVEAIAEALVKNCASHPALLGWYTADEASQQFIPDLTARKKLIRRFDKDHPVWQVHSLGYNTDSFIPYGPSCDVLGLDCYPFSTPERSRIDQLESKLKDSFAPGLPQWYVPQMFNRKRYNAKAAALFPNTGEYLAQLLIAAGCGVKGFVFFKAEDYVTPNKAFGDPAATRRTVIAGNKLLKTLEPFILSDTDPVKLAVKTETGKVSAWRFTNSKGKRCIALVSLTPGKHKAELPLDGSYVSTRNKSTVKNNSALFSVQNIDCDLLMEK